MTDKTNSSCLLVTDIPFWKADLGNRQRILGLVRYLRDTSTSLKVLFLGKTASEDRKILELLGLVTEMLYLEEVAVSREELERVPKKMPGPLEDFYDRAAKAKFNKLLCKWIFETIIVEYIRLDYLVYDLHGEYRTIIDTHDLMGRRCEKYKCAGEQHHIVISHEDEMTLLDRYSYVLAIQHNEYEVMRTELSRAQVLLVSHAVEPKYAIEPIDLLFVSGTSNWKSIVWFMEEVWPRFSNTGMKLHIYGGVCVNLKKYARVNGVFLHGIVASLDAIYRSNSIAINPVLYGGGLKIKSVEALAYGLPLVTTSEGANGLEDAKNWAFLLANTPQEWIEALAILLFSMPLRHALAYNGLYYARKHFVGAMCYGNLGALFGKEEVMQKKPAVSNHFIEIEELLASLHAQLPEFLQHLHILQAQDVIRTADDARQHIEPINERSFELFERYRNSGWRWRIQVLKKVPLLGNCLLYFKHKFLKWNV